MTEFEALDDPTVGEVRIGGLAAMVAGLLPAVVGELRLTHPRLTVSVTQVLTSPTVYDHLRSRVFDLIIGRLPNRPLDGDLVSEKLFDEPISIVAARSSQWARRRKITLAELIEKPWILPQRGTEVGSIIGDIFVANGLPEPTAPVICSSIEMYWGLLATGKFVAAMPMSLLEICNATKHDQRASDSGQTKSTSVGIVTLRNKTQNAGARAFVTRVREMT